MKICIYGAGAGGGHFAVRLALAGHDVSIVARGPHLEAIRSNGLLLKIENEKLHATVHATDVPGDLGPQEIVLVGVKATGLKAITSQLAPLINEDTAVIFPQNGMPWWYPAGFPDGLPPPPTIPTFELGSTFLRILRPEQILSGVIYSANEIEAPGVIKNNSPSFNCLDIAAISAAPSRRLHELREALNHSGIKSRDVADSRAAVWSKLVVNISASVIGLVTLSPSSISGKRQELSVVFLRAANEALQIASASGFDLSKTIYPERMLPRMTDHKPSILQDYEQHRPMEVAEIILAPLCFARAYRVETPTLDVLAALAVNMAAARNLFDGYERWRGVWL